MSSRWGLGSRQSAPYGLPTESLLERATVAVGDELWGIAKVLSEDSSSECITGLRELAQNADVDRRRAAIRALGENSAGLDAADVVLEALHDPMPQVVWAAIEAVADLKLIEANEFVAGLLRRKGILQRPAVMALGEIWLPENFETTLSLFGRSRDETIRKEAAWVLRRHAGAKNWPALFAALSIDEVPRHRVWACEVAAAFGQHSDVVHVAPLEEDRDGHVRSAATSAKQVLSAKA